MLLQEGVLRCIATRMDDFAENEFQEKVTNPPEAATAVCLAKFHLSSQRAET